MIGEADTDSIPLRPLPLECWLIERAAPSVCLTFVSHVLKDKPAAAAGLLAGDFVIGWADRDWTIFDIQGPDFKVMQDKVRSEMLKVRDVKDLVMLVYRPAQGERGMAKGKIIKLRPMPSGLNEYRYTTAESGPTFQRRNSVNYSEQIKKIYLDGKFEQAPALKFDPSALKKDTRVVPGAHQELRDCLVNDAALECRD